MVWCDKLASTPGVGFAFDVRLTPSADVLAALAPIFEEFAESATDRLDFTIDKLDAFALQITTNSGFQYGVTQSRISVEFVHRIKHRFQSAGPPVAELTSQPLPFTVLMPEISRRLIEATMLLPNIKTRKLRRIGVISTTILDEEVMPPGISRLVRYMSRPWQGNIEGYTMVITSILQNGSKYTDKCVHVLAKIPDSTQLPSIRFDWQRWFEAGQVTRAESLEKELRDAREYLDLNRPLLLRLRKIRQRLADCQQHVLHGVLGLKKFSIDQLPQSIRTKAQERISQWEDMAENYANDIDSVLRGIAASAVLGEDPEKEERAERRAAARKRLEGLYPGQSWRASRQTNTRNRRG